MSRRNAASSRSLTSARSFPSSSTLPPVGSSSEARMLSRVVFPEPDSPIIATYSPASTAKFTPRSARTVLPPERFVYSFSSPITSKTVISSVLHELLHRNDTTAGRESKSISVTIPAPYVTVLSPMLQLYQMTVGLSISGRGCDGGCSGENAKGRRSKAAPPSRVKKYRGYSLIINYIIASKHT